MGLQPPNLPPQMAGLGPGAPFVPPGSGMPGAGLPEYASKAMGVQSQGDLRHLWQMVTQACLQLPYNTALQASFTRLVKVC